MENKKKKKSWTKFASLQSVTISAQFGRGVGFLRVKSCGWQHNDSASTSTLFLVVYTLGMLMSPLIKCKHVKMSQRGTSAGTSGVLWWAAGRGEASTWRGIRSRARAARRLRNLSSARHVDRERDESLWLTDAASENIYVAGKAVIIKFEELMACKQPSNEPSEWDGVIYGATPHSTCLSLATHGK